MQFEVLGESSGLKGVSGVPWVSEGISGKTQSISLNSSSEGVAGFHKSLRRIQEFSREFPEDLRGVSRRFYGKSGVFRDVLRGFKGF